ncbi:MAG: hypothetical protein ACOX19_04015 [Fermentimonas sp.]
MKQDEILINYGALYIYDVFEDAVFKFTGMGNGNFCEIKFKGNEPYKAECTTDIATNAYLGGKIITKEEYERYKNRNEQGS